MGSRRKVGSKILGLVTEATARDFLLRLANLGDDSVPWLRSKYPEMFHQSTSEETIFAYRKELRRAWDAPDQRTRDWYVFSLRRHHAMMERVIAMDEIARSGRAQHLVEEMGKLEASLSPKQRQEARRSVAEWLTEPPPQITPLEATLFYFQTRVADLAKHCGHVDCPSPYFIADKRWQKFCSEACAGPANRESKRKWWSENRARK